MGSDPHSPDGPRTPESGKRGPADPGPGSPAPGDLDVSRFGDAVFDTFRLSPAAALSSQFAQAASYVLGIAAIATAAGATILSTDPGDLAGWALDVLGLGFILLLTLLVLITAFSLVRMRRAPDGAAALWTEVGLQAANGVTTLALTFTLLGISLGIGGLAGQELTPETVQAVIRDLTANFSLAFMTTIIGLPVSAVLRAAIAITARQRAPHLRSDQNDSSPEGRLPCVF